MITEAQALADTREYLGRDIALDTNGDIKFGSQNNLSKVDFYDNLKQALRQRFSVTLGEFELHPNYGSQLPEIVSENISDNTVDRIKQAVRASILQEPRIEKITKLTVEYKDNIYRIELEVKPILQKDNLNLVYDLFQ